MFGHACGSKTLTDPISFAFPSKSSNTLVVSESKLVWFASNLRLVSFILWKSTPNMWPPPASTRNACYCCYFPSLFFEHQMNPQVGKQTQKIRPNPKDLDRFVPTQARSFQLKQSLHDQAALRLMMQSAAGTGPATAATAATAATVPSPETKAEKTPAAPALVGEVKKPKPQQLEVGVIGMRIWGAISLRLRRLRLDFPMKNMKTIHRNLRRKSDLWIQTSHGSRASWEAGMMNVP